MVFLELFNYADGSVGSFPVGDGVCKNVCAYSHVKMNERSVAISPPSLDPNSEEYVSFLKKRRAAMKGSITWKDNYLAFCIYVRAGTT